MREMDADLFQVACDAIVITTNGFIKNDGTAVMGRGVALQASQKWPSLPQLLGRSLRDNGNHVVDLWKPMESPLILTMPVKGAWMEKAMRNLIWRSAIELMDKADTLGLRTICLPRPGCGNGALDWEEQIKDQLSNLLDDRFVVVFPVSNWAQTTIPVDGLVA